MDLIKWFYRRNPVRAAKHFLVRDGKSINLSPVHAKSLSVNWEKGLIEADLDVNGEAFICAVSIALRLLLYPGEKVGIFAPSYRQSKIIFKEFTKLVDESPRLSKHIRKMPTVGHDRCQCTMKRVSGTESSGFVVAQPVGTDGSKLKGLRIDTAIVVYEHLPKSILDRVILPMLSVKLDPVASIKALEAKKRVEEVDQK